MKEYFSTNIYRTKNTKHFNYRYLEMMETKESAKTLKGWWNKMFLWLAIEILNTMDGNCYQIYLLFRNASYGNKFQLLLSMLSLLCVLHHLISIVPFTAMYINNCSFGRVNTRICISYKTQSFLNCHIFFSFTISVL